MLLVNEDHLQPIHIRFLNRIRYGIEILLSALRSYYNLTDKLIRRGLNRIHLHRLPIISFLPAKVREGCSTNRQSKGVVFGLRRKTLEWLTILEDMKKCIRIGLGKMEYHYIRILTCLGIFSLHLNRSLEFILIDLDRQDRLCHFCFLRHYLRQRVRAYRQIYLIEIIGRIEGRKLLTIEEDHTKVSVLRQRHYEMEHILVCRTINRGYIEQNRVALLIDHNRLTIHLQLCIYLRENSSTGRQVDEIVVVIRIEGKVLVERALEVHKVFAIQRDIRQRTVIRLVLDVDLHQIIRGLAVLCSHMKRILILTTLYHFLTRDSNGLESIGRSVVHRNITGLERDRIVVTSRLEMIECCAVHRNTCQIHTAALFSQNSEIIIFGSATIFADYSEVSRVTELRRFYGHFLTFMPRDIGNIRHLWLHAFHTVCRQRQNYGIRFRSRIKTINERIIQKDTGQGSIVALRTNNTYTIGLGSARLSLNECRVLNSSLYLGITHRDHLAFLCFNSSKDKGSIRNQFICHLTRQEVLIVSTIDRNSSQIGVVRKRRRIIPSISLSGPRNRPCHLGLVLNKNYRISILLTNEEDRLSRFSLFLRIISGTEIHDNIIAARELINRTVRCNNRIYAGNGICTLRAIFSCNSKNTVIHRYHLEIRFLDIRDNRPLLSSNFVSLLLRRISHTIRCDTCQRDITAARRDELNGINSSLTLLRCNRNGYGRISRVIRGSYLL